MKTTYQTPVVEIKPVDEKDIITTSSGGNELPPMPGEDE